MYTHTIKQHMQTCMHTFTPKLTWTYMCIKTQKQIYYFENLILMKETVYTYICTYI